MQSKTAGAKNEREMVKKLEENHHLLKFGHAFLTPGLGNMASKWILRNNDKGLYKLNILTFNIVLIFEFTLSLLQLDRKENLLQANKCLNLPNGNNHERLTLSFKWKQKHR